MDDPRDDAADPPADDAADTPATDDLDAGADAQDATDAADDMSDASDDADEADSATSSELAERTEAEVAPFDTARLPAAAIESAAPPPAARGLAFTSILIGGLCGALIGFAFTDLQCPDGCNTWVGVGTVVGAVVGAAGVAVVAVLVLRAMDEWQFMQKRDEQ